MPAQAHLLRLVLYICYGMDRVPPNSFVDTLTPGVTVYRDRTFKEVDKMQCLSLFSLKFVNVPPYNHGAITSVG